MASEKTNVAEALAKRFAKLVHIRGYCFHKAMINGRVEMSEHQLKKVIYQTPLGYINCKFGLIYHK